MLPLDQAARRLVIQTSGRFERKVIDLAAEVAAAQEVAEIHPEHVRFAIEKLAGDNAALLENLLNAEGRTHAERRAG